MQEKELSVVVAAQNDGAILEECLSSLQRQNGAGLAEIIVVDNSQDGSARIVEEKFPEVLLLRVLEPRLVPELWALGARSAQGKVIAFTNAHLIPEPEWLSQTLRHHRSPHAAVGGAIENRRPSSLVQWAIYFCRFTPYMPPFSAALVDQVPGDNASYKRWVLESYPDTAAGFWETPINTRLRQEGHSLLLTPEIKVLHGPAQGVRSFSRQRLVHGRLFGAERAEGKPWLLRLLYVARSPLIFPVFLAKIVRNVVGKRRHLKEFLLSSPFLMLFLLSWSIGESLGYLMGYGDRRYRVDEGKRFGAISR